jgi:hypothetical protein
MRNRDQPLGCLSSGRPWGTLDLDVVEQAELDDVHAQLGVLDLP